MALIHSGYLDRYLDDNIKFAKTVNVKLDEAARLMNEGLVMEYGRDIVDTSNPRSWKYYMNLAGQYHPTDTMMTVTSIDTLETIDFTVENLRIHTSTKKAYAYGTRHYNSLVYHYPLQEGLINSILNPVDIDKAIAAESGTILSYPPELIEKNETTLVAELEDYIKRCIARWFNAQFIMSDNLFTATFITQLHMLIYLEMLNLRLKRCKTAEVHSFHLRSYFASHQKLDKYLPYLTLKQSLWLYRNILYIERNAGREKQFHKLIDKLLTDRGIPVGEYSVRHLDNFQDNLRPEPAARRKMINVKQNVLTYDLYTLDHLFDKEIPLAPGNDEYFRSMRAEDRFRVETANTSVTQTKALESSMVDYANAVPKSFEEIALNQWLYMSKHGLYSAVINFKDVKTGEYRVLSSHDAFIYFFYLSGMADGIDFDILPDYLNMQYRIVPKPTVEDLLRVIPHKEHDLRAIAEAIVIRQPQINEVVSVSAFNELCTKLYDEAYWHWFLIANTHDLYERGLVANMVKSLYADVRDKFTSPHANMREFLAANNLPPYDYTREEALALAHSVFEAATGIKLNDQRSLSNIQKAMIELLQHLSSYSIQFIREINDEDIIVIDPPATRIGNQRLGQDDHRHIPVDVFVMDSHGLHITSAPIDTKLELRACHSLKEGDHVTPIDPSVTTLQLGELEASRDIPSCPYYLDITYDGQDVALEDQVLLPGYTSFDRLSDELRAKVKSKYDPV